MSRKQHPSSDRSGLSKADHHERNPKRLRVSVRLGPGAPGPRPESPGAPGPIPEVSRPGLGVPGPGPAFPTACPQAFGQDPGAHPGLRPGSFRSSGSCAARPGPAAPGADSVVPGPELGSSEPELGTCGSFCAIHHAVTDGGVAQRFHHAATHSGAAQRHPGPGPSPLTPPPGSFQCSGSFLTWFGTSRTRSGSSRTWSGDSSALKHQMSPALRERRQKMMNS